MADNDFCDLWVVRHGMTDANKNKILQGHMDTDLNQLGILQAELAAERLKKIHFDAIFSSDLKRACDTAKAIVRFHPGLCLNTDSALRERNFGIFQGKNYEDLRRDHPDIMESLKKDNSDFSVPGGESIKQCNQRVAVFMDQIADRFPGKRVLLVTHGGALQCMFRHAVGIVAPDNLRPFSENTALNIFRRRGKAWQLVLWNDCSHLEQLSCEEVGLY